MDMPTPQHDSPWHPLPEYEQPSAELVAALRHLWREVDAVLEPAQGSCCACGACCDFRVAEHRLFATTMELDVALAWAAAEGVLGARGGVGRGMAAPDDARLCPFWRGGRCAIHPVRPLGCRLFVCDAVGAEPAARAEALGQGQLRGIARRTGRRWWYGPAVAYLRACLGAWESCERG